MTSPLLTSSGRAGDERAHGGEGEGRGRHRGYAEGVSRSGSGGEESGGGVNQCKMTVYRRDTYRRTGRGKTGLDLHYTKGQCARPARETGYCWQHEDEGTDQEWHEQERQAEAEAKAAGERTGEE